MSLIPYLLILKIVSFGFGLLIIYNLFTMVAKFIDSGKPGSNRKEFRYQDAARDFMIPVMYTAIIIGMMLSYNKINEKYGDDIKTFYKMYEGDRANCAKTVKEWSEKEVAKADKIKAKDKEGYFKILSSVEAVNVLSSEACK